MEESKNEQQMPEVSLIPARVEMKLSIDLMKAHGNYQQFVQEVLNWEVDEDNFEKSQELNKKMITFLAFIEDHRGDEKKPYLEAGRAIDAAHKKISGPLEIAKGILQLKINKVGVKMAEDAKRTKMEKDRIEGLKNLINGFIQEKSTEIAAATTNEQLLSIERLINLEKGNKGRYQDHLPLLIERCNDLTSMIKEQKGIIQELERLEKEKVSAYEAGNDEKVQELQQKTDILGAKMEENTILVQETASKSVILTEVVAPEVDMPNTRRKSWKFEIVDVREAMKKRPDLLDVSLNNKSVSEVLKTLKETGVLNGKTEYILNGIRFYQDVNY